MSASQLFQIANIAALLGWILLIAGVILRQPFLRDALAGRWWPLGFSALYLALILLFFGKAEGGFDSLENVQRLFVLPWAALAGWVHYLAFDLFVGGWIARRTEDLGLPRWPLIALLPLTFLFGPIGFLAFELVRALFARKDLTS